MNNIELFKVGAKEFGLEIKEEEEEKFGLYKELLKEWNEKINITAIVDDAEIVSKHFLDSLSIFTLDYFNGRKKLIDIGTGGGFPGLPMKILRDDLDITLLDSLNKRIMFLNEVIDKLKLRDIRALHGRAEELSRKEEFREKFDLAVSRAVAPLNTLSEYSLPFIKVGGYFISMKGPDVADEVNEARRAIQILGGKIVDTKLITLPSTDIVHSLIIIEKIRQTPTKYPRAGGKPRKAPL